MTDPESYPKLVAPEEASGGAASDETPASDAPDPTHADSVARLLPGVLGFLLLLAIVGLIGQARSISTLQEQVTVLGEQLTDSRADLEAYRERMARVRVEVSELFGRIGALRDLVEEPPSTGSPTREVPEGVTPEAEIPGG